SPRVSQHRVCSARTPSRRGTHFPTAFIVLILAGLGTILPASAQDLPDDFWPARNLAILHDFGRFWPVNSAFKPYRWERLWAAEHHNGVARSSGLGWVLADLLDETATRPRSESSQDSLQMRIWSGTQLQQPFGEAKPFSEFAASPYLNLSLWFRQNLNVEVYLRATSDPQSLAHFTGRPREIRRFGINAAEFDHAVVSYHNSWLIAQFGRGRQVWGALESSNLVLSAHSAAYDHFLFEGRYKRMKLRFFYGFLESSLTEGVNINRYLVGHGLEYSNRRNLVVGVSELITLSGEDRPLDIAYLNPLLPVLEVELNDRTNKDLGTASSNAVWSFMFDWMPVEGFRLSGNYTIDEFQFDSKDRDEGRPDATAYQMRTAYSRNVGRLAATLSFDYTRVGTFTFRHTAGGNNFVSRNFPLGTDIGSDADRWRLGLRMLFPWRIILSARFGGLREGERSILNSAYQEFTDEEFQTGPFPSGQVHRTKFIDWNMSYLPLRNLEFQVFGRYAKGQGRFTSDQKFVVLSLNMYLPVDFGF
ncbi:MAG: hypothetical protein ACE5IR_18400, partial [bacterium]